MSHASRAFKTALLLSLTACAAAHGHAPEDDTDGASSALGEPATLTFTADWRADATGPLRAASPIALDYDVSRLSTCRGDQGGVRQWAVTAYWRVDGDAPSTLDVSDGHASFTPTHAGDLQLWFQITNRWGCVAYDSVYGANFHFAVQPSANAPGWVGNAASVVARGTCSGAPCDSDRKPLDGTIFDDWARTRAEIANAYFDVWKEGVTDWDDPNLWKELDVEAHARFVGQSTWTTRYVGFDQRVNHDARYAQPLRAFDPFVGAFVTDPSTQCPKVPYANDGTTVSATLEIYFSVNGAELRPAAADAFHVVYRDQAGLYSACTSP